MKKLKTTLLILAVLVLITCKKDYKINSGTYISENVFFKKLEVDNKAQSVKIYFPKTYIYGKADLSDSMKYFSCQLLNIDNEFYLTNFQTYMPKSLMPKKILLDFSSSSIGINCDSLFQLLYGQKGFRDISHMCESKNILFKRAPNHDEKK